MKKTKNWKKQLKKLVASWDQKNSELKEIIRG